MLAPYFYGLPESAVQQEFVANYETLYERYSVLVYRALVPFSFIYLLVLRISDRPIYLSVSVSADIFIGIGIGRYFFENIGIGIDSARRYKIWANQQIFPRFTVSLK